MRHDPGGTDVRNALARAWAEVRHVVAPTLAAPVRRAFRRLAGGTRRGALRLGRATRRGARGLASGARRAVDRVTPRQVVVGFGALLLAGVVGWQRCGIAGCPSVQSLVAFQPGKAPLLLDRHGEELARLRPLDRVPIPLDSVPEHVRQAFVAIEDRRFRSHDGVDWLRVPGAFLANARAGEVREGFSTITMQLARNAFPDRMPGDERTLRRKLLEIRVAGEIEDRFEKDEILELYLNHIYFGDGVRGIRAAARHWFGTDPRHLTLEEGALLAALPKGPERYHPRRHPDRARERRDLVLDRMAEEGMIDEEEAEAAKHPLRIASFPLRPREKERPAPYFVDQARRVLEARFGERLYAVPLRIRTTLDREVQRAVEQEIDRQIWWVEAGGYGRFAGPRYDPSAAAGDSTPYLQGAAVVVEVATGDVLALVGGRDFGQSTFDRAVGAHRQVGSAFKPFVYAAALAEGVGPDELLDDSPLTLEVGDSTWTPRNFDGRHVGRVTVREALVRSLNVPTVRLAERVGTERIARIAEAAGVAPDVSSEPSMALGTASSSPLDMAVAYTALAGDGVRVEPRFVLSAEDEGGDVLWEAEVRRDAVLDPEVARGVTDMLRDAVDRGTGRNVRRAGFRGPAAGKTGTTSDGRDAWFVGYTPEMVGAVWIGFDRPRTIFDGASGGTLAAPVWGRAFVRIYQGRTLDTTFVAPAEEDEGDGLFERLRRWLFGGDEPDDDGGRP